MQLFKILSCIFNLIFPFLCFAQTFSEQNLVSTSVAVQAYAGDIDNDGDHDVLTVSLGNFPEIAWHENTNNPICVSCAKTHKVSDIKKDFGQLIRRQKRKGTFNREDSVRAN